MSANDPEDPTLVAPIPPGGEVTPSHDTEPSPGSTSTPRDAGGDLELTQVSPQPPAPPSAPGSTPLPTGYVLSREIARGGMGVVYAARDEMFDRDVAVKVMRPGQDAGRFDVEARVTARLTHPGIPPVYHLGKLADGRPFLAMKFVEGRTLEEELNTAGGTQLPRLLGLFESVCQTVGFAHSKGIIHRDLKPSNVMVGAFGEVQVMDWGLAKCGAERETGGLGAGACGALERGAAETLAGQVKGTPAYMAPEQARGESVDTRADVFALGGILARILTGRPPFVGDTALATVLMAGQADLHAILGRLDACGADGELVALAKRCLDPDRAGRPRSGGELAELVATHRAGVESRLRAAEQNRAIREAKVRDQRRRMRVLLQMLVVAFVLLAVAAALGLWAATTVTERTKANVTAENTENLARSAGYATRMLEDRLQRHVASLDQWAADIHTTKEAKEKEVVPALKVAAAVPRGATPAGGASLAPEGHRAVREWLNRLHKQRRSRAAEGDHLPTLGVMLVTDADTGEPQSRGFYVARVHPDGTAEDAVGYADPRDRALFASDMSYRDYFSAGPQGEAPNDGRPHAVVRAPHISHPFRSRGIDRNARGEQRERWKLNVVSPIWDDPDPQVRSRVIGLLVLGLDVEYDIKPLLYPAGFTRPGGAEAGYGIERLMKVVVTDHRGRWVWHPDCGSVLDSDRPEFRHPHAYPDLVRKHGLTDERAGPWLALDAPSASGDRYGYSESVRYVDALEVELHGDRGEEIACFTRFDPYKLSRYAGQDATGRPGPQRRWAVVTQVDRRTALRPLDDMKGAMVRIGGTFGAVLVLGMFFVGLRAAFLWRGGGKWAAPRQ